MKSSNLEKEILKRKENFKFVHQVSLLLYLKNKNKNKKYYEDII